MLTVITDYGGDLVRPNSVFWHTIPDPDLDSDPEVETIPHAVALEKAVDGVSIETANPRPKTKVLTIFHSTLCHAWTHRTKPL